MNRRQRGLTTREKILDASGELSSALDLPGEARFIHASLTGYFHRSLLPGWPADVDDALSTIVQRALRCFRAPCEVR